eukprot:CAMPEP_0205890332 /NCGR_PEP_ID=MMETSP1083-20121108/21471_1 /ASSEMBLY_ACC=CAM_ASM_000430 /TAXON_ID=97485 /ORGANISM="Prymnesium parvum, Strain Texoma1" /LENGTH=120 /DNA_ID=CAMNT_0053254545 /DNA_START=829 /DNA_END=1189 /DNA_ORIENTATION=+
MPMQVTRRPMHVPEWVEMLPSALEPAGEVRLLVNVEPMRPGGEPFNAVRDDSVCAQSLHEMHCPRDAWLQPPLLLVEVRVRFEEAHGLGLLTAEDKSASGNKSMMAITTAAESRSGTGAM